MLVALLIVVLVTALFLAWFYLFRNNTDIPVSPGSKPIVGHMHHFMDVTKDTLYLGFNTVTAAEPLLKSNVNINKNFQYDAVSGWLKNSVLVLPGQEWQKRRKMLTPAFHFNILEDFSETMKKHASLFVSMLKADPTKLICEVIEEATFYSLCETSFGIEFESGEEAKALFAPMAALMAEFAMRTSSQNPLIQSDWYYNRTQGGKLWNSSVHELNRHIMGMINKAKTALELGETKLHKGKRAFLDQMVYEQAERGELTDEQGKDFDDIEHGSLPYLGMVVKETLRLQPPASIIGRRLTEPMDADGHMLPAGTNLDVSIWWLHRDPEHWDNAEEFDPERFSEENSRGRNPYAFVPFSAGPRNCIGQRFGNVETRKRAFLDQMVSEQAERGDFTDEQIIGECNTILLAGHATTTGTIAFCVYYLCRHQDVQERLYKEIADHLEGKDFDDIEHGSLPYLGMVVRLQPPASTMGRRLSEPMYADGHMLPAGTNLDVSIWWLHRDPEHWDNAEEFDPERFSEKNSRGRNPYAFVPFSAGPRNCIGQKFANVETRLFIAALVYNFKMTSEQEIGKGLFRNIQGVSAVPGPDFKVDFTPRV
ncbi:cytochrome P450 4ae1-like [Bolinopsis microptera]|uniref:cytochrome P450 4ae1-like n=1 Tax=Bolinopsis microptera TaxID=2820187 RepID=UPI003079D6CB